MPIKWQRRTVLSKKALVNTLASLEGVEWQLSAKGPCKYGWLLLSSKPCDMVRGKGFTLLRSAFDGYEDVVRCCKENDVTITLVDLLADQEGGGKCIGASLLRIPVDVNGAVEIAFFAICEKVRGLGHGARMVDAIRQLCKFVECHKVVVHSSKGSINFWKKLGFVTWHDSTVDVFHLRWRMKHTTPLLLSIQ